MRPWFVAPVLIVLLGPARGGAQCPSPADLCTGDPCVTAATAVTTPCTLDFGNVEVIVHAIDVTGSGTVTVKARAISVYGVIQGRGTDAPTIELFADDTFYNRSLVDVSASVTPGTIHVRAGGDVTLDGKMRATGTAGFATAGGTIIVEAGGVIRGPTTFSHDITGGKMGPAGTAIYRGDGGIDLLGHLIMRGLSGGHAEFTSAHGAVVVGTDVRARKPRGPGASLVLSAATDAIVARGLQCDGSSGGSLTVSGATVTLPKHQGLKARGIAGAGGTVVVTGGSVVADEGLSATGSPGGTVTVTAGSIAINRYVRAGGHVGGGRIALLATGDLGLKTLADASPSGTIDAHAGGSLVVAGTVHAGPSGCIGLSAGGTLSTAGAAFDLPIAASCP